MIHRRHLSLLILATMLVAGLSLAGFLHVTRYSLAWFLFLYMLLQSALVAFFALKSLGK